MSEVHRKPYFYDSQLKRILVQLMSMFSGYQARTGRQRDGDFHYKDVPVMYGDASRTVGYLVQGGTENAMATVPMISIYMTGLKQAENYRHTPTHTEKYSFIERARDKNGNLLINVPGTYKIAEKYMPVPYEMRFELAIWASNNDQGYQILEQILTVFNPELDIELSNSPQDWSWATTVFFGGDVKFEKAIPAGTEPDPLYVYTLGFTVIVWLSVPTKVYDLVDIRKIEVKILQLEADLDFEAMEKLDGLIISADKEGRFVFN